MTASEKIKLIMETTYKKVFVKYQADAKFLQSVWPPGMEF